MIEIIVNSNNKNSLKKLAELECCLKQERIVYKVLKTSEKENATSLMDKIKGDNLIVIGGDGTINEVMNNYHKENIIYFASGSGNDLGRSLQLDKKVSKVTKLLENGEITYYDVGEIDGRKFCTGFDIGYNADVIRRVESSKFKKYFRKYIYLFCGIISILNLKKYNAEIIFNNKKIETTKLYLLNVMLQPYEGGGVKFSHTASGKDGMFHILIMRNMNPPLFVYNYLCLLLKRHDKLKKVEIYTAKTLTVKTNQNYYQVDGELIKNKKQLMLKCLEKYYKIKK
ncbi:MULTISPECIES: diacylglycerol/lipid kinase family protein [Gemella]|uniref:diacylglycerol/lipid kinase family protein n=1 Tax=Gemella TaxID=1378 RepID=UPI000767E14E|nr:MULTISPECIES: diacylglycerol kinase family protein [Gemella]AME08870.1 diacylglycerol kinase [Gemella sp. oral taxon 928]